MIFNVEFKCVHFCGSEAVDTAFLHSSVRFEVNGMVPWLVLGQAFRSLFAKDRAILSKLSRNVVKMRSFLLDGKVRGVRSFGMNQGRFVVLEDLLSFDKRRSSDFIQWWFRDF